MATSRTKRHKQAAAQHLVPQTQAETNQAIATIGQHSRDLQRMEAAMNDELSAIKDRFEAGAEPLRNNIKVLEQGVKTWCEANRATLTQDGKTKTATLPAGTVQWRMRPSKVVASGIDDIIAACKKLRLSRFLRIKVELNKEAMLAEPKVASKLDGIKIEQGEDFIITPFEAELA